MPPKSKPSFAPKNAVRYLLAGSVTIATLLGAQSLAFSERSSEDNQTHSQQDVISPSITALIPTQQVTNTLMPTSTLPPTNTPSSVPVTASSLPIVVATVTAVPPTNTPLPSATAIPTQVPTRVVAAQQQPRPKSRSSRH